MFHVFQTPMKKTKTLIGDEGATFVNAVSTFTQRFKVCRYLCVNISSLCRFVFYCSTFQRRIVLFISIYLFTQEAKEHIVLSKKSPSEGRLWSELTEAHVKIIEFKDY